MTDMDVNSASVSTTKSSEDKNSSNVDAQKITKFFPVLRTEGRAKMCAMKTGDSKQKELLQKFKKKEGMTLRPKSEAAKLTVEQQPKTDSVPSPPNKEKIRNISVLAALKTPLSQVLRRSIEEAESKKELSEKNTQISEKSSTSIDSVTVKEKKDLSNEGSAEETIQKAKKSLSEGESGMSLRGAQKSSLSLRSSLTKKSSEGSPTPSVNLRKKSDLSESGATKNASGSRGSSAEERSENGSSSNQNSNSAKAKKSRKRHFRGSTYGLYLTPAKKKKQKQKQKSHDESKDDECSLAGTENSSYLDSEDGNSLVSEDFYTPSEKSLADDEHNPDSRNSPMLSNSEPKTENTEPNRSVEQREDNSEIEQQEDNSEIEQQEDNSEIEQQEDNSENCEQNVKLEESESNLMMPSACDEISQNATDILQHLDEMQWEPTQKFDDNSEENQFVSETLKAPQYDDISNESFSNSTIFPFKECAIENSEDGNIQEKDVNETEKSDELTSADVVTEDSINMKSEDRELLPEISENFMDVNENITDVFENKDNSDPSPFEEATNVPDGDGDPDPDQDPDPDPDQDPDPETGTVSPPVSEEKEEIRDKDNQEVQSTIATCVKSRQRIKRRFTDDIVDTELGILSLSAMPAVRKIPAPKPDPPKDIIENFQSTTRSEAKKGPVTKIECIFNTHQNPVKNCTCEGDTYAANLGQDDDGVFCQAVDSIDDKLVGCSNPVVTTRLVRSSVKIPFTIMCEMHLWRLKHHHSCPYCGLFCSQGYFMQCTNSKHKKMVHLFHEQCQSKEEGHIPFCLHCGASTGLKRVQLEMQMANPPAFTLSQLSNVTLPVVSKARISYSATSEFLKKEEDELLHQTYTVDDTGKILSSAGLPSGTEKEELDKLLQILEETKVKSDIYSPDIFYDSAAKGDVLKVLYVLAQGFDPNHKFPNHENETALHAAAAGGHTSIVHLLIQAGAVNDSLNDKMCTPLMLAVENNHKDAVHYLVKKGALVDFKGENGMSSLHLAAKIGNLDVLKILMSSRDVDVNSQDDGGWTPIVWASEHDHYNVVKYLLKRGANPNLKDSEGNTGLHWSAFSGSVDICYLYLDYGCDINAVNERGDTPIHIAARQDSFPCVTLFLSRGADVQIVNKANQLPAECCIDKNSDTYLSLSLNMLLKKITGKYQHKSEKILHRDISRGKEQIAIQCVNGVDDEPPPLDYLYVTENCETMPIKIDRTITSLQSCHCEDDCSSPSCTCSSISYQCWYDKEGLLVPEFNLLDPPMLFECNRACSCWSLNCHNRVLQNGITSRLQLIRTKGKGWGVRTLKDIPKGTFICEYVGELISDSAADKRSDDSYLFDLDNRDGETYCLDARYYGNISRFINHLCEPNLVPVKIYVDHQDLNFPRIAFFSSRDIKQYEELGFDYGEKFWAIKYKFFTCDCGSPKCKYSKDTIHITLANYYRRLKEEQMEEAAVQDQQVIVQPE